jgi:hypothetical protein
MANFAEEDTGEFRAVAPMAKELTHRTAALALSNQYSQIRNQEKTSMRSTTRAAVGHSELMTVFEADLGNVTRSFGVIGN